MAGATRDGNDRFIGAPLGRAGVRVGSERTGVRARVTIGVCAGLDAGAGASDESRVATGLAQLQQRVEHGDTAARQASLLDGLSHPSVLAQAYAVIEIALPLVELNGLYDLNFRR